MILNFSYILGKGNHNDIRCDCVRVANEQPDVSSVCQDLSPLSQRKEITIMRAWEAPE